MTGVTVGDAVGATVGELVVGDGVGELVVGDAVGALVGAAVQVSHAAGHAWLMVLSVHGCARSMMSTRRTRHSSESPPAYPGHGSGSTHASLKVRVLLDPEHDVLQPGALGQPVVQLMQFGLVVPVPSHVASKNWPELQLLHCLHLPLSR